jgi:hypothetical protein
MPLDDETRIEIASLIDNAQKAAAAEHKTAFGDIADRLGKAVDAITKMGARMDELEDASERRAKDAARDRIADARHARKADDNPPPDARPLPLAADDEATERGELAKAQGRADEVAIALGQRAPAPWVGETSIGYRRRLAKLFRHHSENFKQTDLDAISDKMFPSIEAQIFADAMEVGLRPPQFGPGQLLPRSTRNEAGHTIITYHGDPRAWMDFFAGGVQLKGTGMWKAASAGR